jgi:hypothetical protein
MMPAARPRVWQLRTGRLRAAAVRLPVGARPLTAKRAASMELNP